MDESQVIQMRPFRIASGCTAGHAPGGASWDECEALLDQHDVVLVNPTLMITRLDRMEKITGGLATTAMTDQIGAQLRDIAAQAGQPSESSEAPSQP
jgi:hypothetical protein